MKTLTHEQEKWIKALKSGKYKQTKGKLHRDDRFCCLGVACDISGLGTWDNHLKVYAEYYMNGTTYWNLLPTEVANRLNLINAEASILEKFWDSFFHRLCDLGYAGGTSVNLIGYNDGGATFKMLAQVIREMPEAVFKYD